jgi:DNA-binding transcriptional MerR regulator
MKTTNKKLVGGLLVGLLIATVGAAFATGQTDDITDDTTPHIPFEGRHGMRELGPFASELTDKQQTELEELMTTLREQNATPEEIRTAIQGKFDEFGVLDTQLDNEIAQTDQRLTILNRQKELRNEGYSWDEIRNIIEDEFDLENTTGVGQDMMFEHGFERRPCRGSRGFITSEESDQ